MKQISVSFRYDLATEGLPAERLRFRVIDEVLAMPVPHMFTHSFLHLLTCSFILVNEYSLITFLDQTLHLGGAEERPPKTYAA